MLTSSYSLTLSLTAKMDVSREQIIAALTPIAQGLRWNSGWQIDGQNEYSEGVEIWTEGGEKHSRFFVEVLMTGNMGQSAHEAITQSVEALCPLVEGVGRLEYQEHDAPDSEHAIRKEVLGMGQALIDGRRALLVEEISTQITKYGASDIEGECVIDLLRNGAQSSQALGSLYATAKAFPNDFSLTVYVMLDDAVRFTLDKPALLQLLKTTQVAATLGLEEVTQRVQLEAASESMDALVDVRLDISVDAQNAIHLLQISACREDDETSRIYSTSELLADIVRRAAQCPDLRNAHITLEDGGDASIIEDFDLDSQIRSSPRP